MLCVDHVQTVDGALRNVTAGLPVRRFAVLTGPDRDARRALLRLLAGHTRAAHGRTLLDGVEVQEWMRHEFASRCALMPQGRCLAFGCNALDMVLFGRCSGHGDRASPVACAAAMDALTALEAVELADRPWPTLRVDEQCRVQLARTLARIWRWQRLEGRYLLLDEPLRGLPEAVARRLWVLLLRLSLAGLSVLLSVDPEQADLAPADLRWWCEDGRLDVGRVAVAAAQ